MKQDNFLNSKSELIQILLNILNNARDVFLERNIQNSTIKISFSEDNECQKIFIEDNAKGIDEKIIMNVFDPYFSKIVLYRFLVAD